VSALTLTLRAAPTQTVDMSSITPDRLAGKSAADVAALELPSGNRRLKVGDMFEVAFGEAANIVIRSGSAKLNRIGLGMSGGSITVEGDAGAYLGMGMIAGRILVSGSTGAWTGSGMLDGTIQVRGDAGDFLAAAIPGDKQGMAGGTIVIEGNAGARVGDHLRRGMVLIKGNTGDYCGSRMLAGTIMVGGKTSSGVGFGMKRGTLLLAQMPLLSATFNDCGRHHLPFLNLLHRHLRAGDPSVAGFARDGDRVRRFMGDLANDGKGELLVYA
jgi:formylmethanofuran dehydrogenase subunit C